MVVSIWNKQCNVEVIIVRMHEKSSHQ